MNEISDQDWSEKLVKEYIPPEVLTAGGNSLLFSRKEHFLFLDDLWKLRYFRQEKIVPLQLLQQSISYPVKAKMKVEGAPSVSRPHWAAIKGL